MDENAYRNMDDAELVRREREMRGRGDRRAYGELVRRYSRLIYCECRGFLCRARFGRPQDAEDLTQETFLCGLSHLGKLKKPEVFASWVCGIARHVCTHWVERHENHNCNLNPSDPELPGCPMADSHDDLLDLNVAMGRLPDKWRQALLLLFEDYSYREIADRFGVRPATVNKWLSKARKQLRDDLNPPEDDSDR